MPLKLAIIKFSKKLVRTLLYSLSIIGLLLLLFYCLFRTSAVQTWVIGKATNYLSDDLKTKIHIGGVDIEFVKKIVLEDVFIQDLHGDTLLYSPAIKVDIAELKIKKQKLILKNISLSGTKAKIIRYKNEPDFNYSFLIDFFSSEGQMKDTISTRWDFGLNSLVLNNIDFVYRDEHDTSTVDGINYADIHTRRTFASVKNIKFIGDTVKADIIELSAIEKSGFILTGLSCNATLCPTLTQLEKLVITTSIGTQIVTDLTFKYGTYSDYNNFIDKVTMKASFDSSKIEMADIAYFAPELKGISQKIILTGKIGGKVTGLKAKKISLSLGKNTVFKGDVELKGLPDINETFISLDIQQLTSTKEDLEQLPSFPFRERKKINIPGNVEAFGKMNFKGNFSGFLTDFVAYGTFSSALGVVSSDIAMQQVEGKNRDTKYSGKIKSKNFNLGKLLLIDEIGDVTADVHVEGTGLQKSSLNADLKGVIQSISFNKYDYKNINVEGKFAQKIFSGKFNIEDDNIKMDFKGDIDFAKTTPLLSFNAEIEKARLTALHFSNNENNPFLSACVNINMEGVDIDKATGSIHVTDMLYKDRKEIYELKNMEIKLSEIKNSRSIILNSDFADATVSGKFKALEMPAYFQELISDYIPALKEKMKINYSGQPSFIYDISFKNSSNVTRLFFPYLNISSGSYIKGNYNSADKNVSILFRSPQLKIYSYTLKDFSTEIEGNNGKLIFKTSSDKINNNDSTFVEKFNINAATNFADNTVTLKTVWFHAGDTVKKSKIDAIANFSSSNKMQLKISPSSSVYISDSLWSFGENNNIEIDSSTIKVDSIAISNAGQFIKIQGALSQNKNDKIILSLKKFNLSTLNPFLKSADVELKGIIKGSVSLSDLYNNPEFYSDIEIKALSVNNEYIGDGSLKSAWNKERDAISLDGMFTRNIVPNIKFTGNYFPNKTQDNLDIKIALEAVKLNTFKKFVKNYCSYFEGQASGSLSVKGNINKPVITGKLDVSAKKISVDYLGTYYLFNTQIIVDPNSFGVENMEVHDPSGNIALVTGHVYHDNFKNFQMDFDINAKKFMCLNTTQQQNELYYGKANFSGIINFFGFADNITIDAIVKTEKGTKFNIPLTSTSELSEHNFISFVKNKKDSLHIEEKYKVDLRGMQMNFDMEVTPDAESQIIFDSKIGDIIKGRGYGNIKMNINTLGSFNMYGDFNITEGDYLFTLKNIINKHFDIEKGGTIKWSGDPYEANVNLTAIYKQRALLSPFFPGDSTGKYKKRYPVDCRLNMNGRLMSPDISFDIELPSVDENTRQEIKNYISTDQEMNRQVFSLLILKSFVTPPQLTNSGVAESGISSAGAATSTELLSNQLNNMLSQISKDFDIGVNYRPGDHINDNELEVALSTQLLNDRITIDGNFGYVNSASTATQNNTSNYVGDINVEYKITDDGKFRVKGFNKANDNTSLTTSSGQYTQGVGLFYREEFNALADLYKRYFKKIKKDKTPINNTP